MKKLICIVLTLVLMFTCFPITAFSEVTETSGSYEDKMTWEYNENTKTLYVTCDGALDFPYEMVYEDSYGGKAVVYKAYPWHTNGFYNETEHLVLQGNMTEIGDHAFYKFHNLSDISFPAGIERIDSFAFATNYGLKEIVIPESVKVIEQYAFYSSARLKRVTLPENLEELGAYAFGSSYELESFTLPDHLKRLGTNVVATRTGNTEHLFERENGFYYIGKYIVGHYMYSGDGITEAIVREGTPIIPDKLFYLNDAGIQSIKLPNSVKCIGDLAFYHTKLESIDIPSSVEYLGEGAFKSCQSLKSVTIPNSITELKNEIFYGTGLTSVTLPKSLKTIGERAFSQSAITKITIPQNVQQIAGDAFSSCYKLSAVTVNEKNSFYSAKVGVLFNKKQTALLHYPSRKAGKHYLVPSSVKYIKGSISSFELETVGIPKTVKKCSAPISVKIYYFGTRDEFDKIYVYESAKAQRKIKVKCCTAKLSKTRYTYNGKTQTPTVKVYDASGTRLKEKTDYTVSLPKGRKSINKYTIKVKLKGKYKGEFHLTYRISPKGTTLKSATAGVASMKIKWNRQTKHMTGYELQYAQDDAFSRGKTTLVISKNKTSKTIKNLSVLQTYYVHIRTYKKVGNKKVYSAWSKSKKVKVIKAY